MKRMLAIVVGSLVLAAGTAAAQTTSFYIRGDIGIALAADCAIGCRGRKP
jgi:hypothetical protein